MHLLPLLLALACTPVRAEEAVRPAVNPLGPPPKSVPEACKTLVTAEKWSKLPDWQRFYVLKELTEKKAPCQNALARLSKESDRRLVAEVDRLYLQMRNFQDRRRKGEVLTVAERVKFSRDALNAETEYPGATVLNRQKTDLADIREAGARWELEAEYILSHPADARFQTGLKPLRDSRRGNKSLLDALFDGSRDAANPFANAGPVHQPPGGVRPAPGRNQNPSSGATPPPAPQVRFEPEPPSDAAARKQWEKSGAAAKEKAYFLKVMAGLQTRTERAVLERLGKNQAAYEEQRASELADLDRQIQDTQKRLVKAEARRQEIPALAFRQGLRDLQRERTEVDLRSSELLVSMSDLNGSAGTAGWDDKAASDGKIHLHARFDRDNVDQPKTHTYAMKVFTHEFSHNADQADPKGMARGVTERRAYLNGAKAYKEEGEPSDTWELQGEARIYQTIKRDPLEWTVSHLTSPTYVEKGNLMSYTTADDILDPQAGLRWRLRLAYDYASRIKRPDSKQSPSDAVKESVKALHLDEEIGRTLVKVWRDATIPGSEKSRVFAERAGKTPAGQEWVADIRDLSAEEKTRIFKEQTDYWKDLGAFYLSP